MEREYETSETTERLRHHKGAVDDYSQNSPPQDSPLGGNPEVGNPESISYQDYPPQLLCFYALFVHDMGPG